MAASGGQAPFDSTLIGNSIWLEGAGTSGDAMTRTWGAESNQDRWIWSTWYSPLREIDSSGDTNTFFASGSGSNGFYFTHSSSSSQFFIFCRDNAGNEGSITTSEFYRDVGSWYHVLVDFDSANALANDRISLYVNGVRVGAYSGTAIGQNNHIAVNVSGQTAHIGQDLSGTPNAHMQGYLAQTVFLDNKSIANGDLAITDFLDTFTFGTNGSQIVPKKDSDIIALASAAGNNSFCLDYASGSDPGNDASSKNNDFSTSTIGTANQSVHTPSKVYAVWNPLRNFANSAVTLSDGNLKMSGGDGPVLATKAIPSTGKWVVTAEVSQGDFTLGVATESVGNIKLGNDAKGFCMVDTNVTFLSRTNNTDTNTTSASSAGNKVIAAFDADTGKLWLGRDTGSGYTYLGGGNPATGATPTYTISSTETLYFAGGSAGGTFACDFGQNGFDGTVPSGFESLNSSNLTAPDFQGIDYFDATIYEGNGDNQRVGDFVPFTDTYTVDNSAMWNSADLRRLSITYSSQPAATSDNSSDAAVYRKASLSFWIKFLDYPDSSTNHQVVISQANSAQNNRFFYIIDNPQSTNSVLVGINSTAGTDGAFYFDKNLFSGQEWSHFLLHLDTNNATAADRMKVWINGNAVTSTNDYTGMTQGLPLNLFQDEELLVGHLAPTSAGYTANYNFNSYLAEFHLIDGSCQAVTNFGQVDTSTNRWVAKDYKTNVGTYGNRGFYLKFDGTPGASTGSNMGKDSSGNNNHLAEAFGSGGSAWADGDQFIDTPSKNFPTIDHVFSNGATPVTLSEGNLTGVRSSSGFQHAYSNLSGFRMQENTGIYFAEVLAGSDTTNFDVGVLSGDPPSSTNRYLGQDSNTYGYDRGSGNKVNDGAGVSYGASYTAGDVLGIEIDTDTGSINFHKNGADQGQAFTAVPGPYAFAFDTESGGGPMTFNFGQQMDLGGSATTLNATADGRFKHTPPTGAKALNQDNLDDTASKLTAWAWIKNRDATDSHMLFDRVRGVGVEVHTDGTTTTPETTNVNTVQRFLQRGVQVGSDVQVNTANESYVLWQWLVGDSATTGTSIGAGSISTGVPSIASTVLAADAGHFSVVSWTGNTTAEETIGHGLGGTPEFIIAIARAESGQNKPVYHKFMTADTDHLKINEDNAQGTAGTSIWDVDAMSSTLIGLGANTQSNSTNGMIAYCFRSIPGVCKVGKYIPNNVIDGPYISLGFTPAMILLKCINTSNPWMIFDNTRDVDNPVVRYLHPNSTSAEKGVSSGTGRDIDFLSDGFKIREDDSDINGGTSNPYLFVAMADLGGNGTLPPIYGR